MNLIKYLKKSQCAGRRGVASSDAAFSAGALLARLRGAEQLVGGSLNVVVIQEAGLDGFWVHRSLEANDIESHVVDPASVSPANC